MHILFFCLLILSFFFLLFFVRMHVPSRQTSKLLSFGLRWDIYGQGGIFLRARDGRSTPTESAHEEGKAGESRTGDPRMADSGCRLRFGRRPFKDFPARTPPSQTQPMHRNPSLPWVTCRRYENVLVFSFFEDSVGLLMKYSR